jgi:hypothetical protein
MTVFNYEEIILRGERVDWYGIEVPKDLLTNKVLLAAETLSHEIHLLEGELSDLRGKERETREVTIKLLKKNLQNMPFVFNGDVYLVKKNRLEEQLQKKVEKTTTKKRKTTSKETTPKKTGTKNSNLIFGKK